MLHVRNASRITCFEIKARKKTNADFAEIFRLIKTQVEDFVSLHNHIKRKAEVYIP